MRMQIGHEEQHIYDMRFKLSMIRVPNYSQHILSSIQDASPVLLLAYRCNTWRHSVLLRSAAHAFASVSSTLTRVRTRCQRRQYVSSVIKRVA